MDLEVTYEAHANHTPYAHGRKAKVKEALLSLELNSAEPLAAKAVAACIAWAGSPEGDYSLQAPAKEAHKAFCRSVRGRRLTPELHRLMDVLGMAGSTNFGRYNADIERRRYIQTRGQH